MSVERPSTARLFEKNSRFAHFRQKLSKMGHFGPKCPKMEVFRIFLGIPSLLFTETLQLIRAFNSEKMFQTLFLKKIPFCPFWPKIVQNWPFGWMCATVSLRAGNSWKTWKNLFSKPISSKFLSYYGKQPIHILKAGDQ